MGRAENEIKAKCRKILELRGWWVRNNPVGRFRLPRGKQCSITIGRKGEADMLAISPVGCLLWLEYKRSKGGKFSSEQLEFAENMRQRGVPCLAINDPDKLVEWLDERPWMERVEG